MPPSTVPYIGSKISLISNSEIRYEGILYTINTQESTIALQSVRCFGTEGRKMPEIPPSSEVYDFIIFRGQDIKDLTVLEACNAVNDPAIVSINQKPAGGKASQASGSSGGAGKGSFMSSSAEKGKGSSAPSGRSHGGGNAAINNIFSSWGGSTGTSTQSRDRGGSGRKGEDYGATWGPSSRSTSDYPSWTSSSAGAWGGASWASSWGGGKDYSWSASSYGKGSSGGGQKGWSESPKGKGQKGAAESSKGKAQKGAVESGKGKAQKGGKAEPAKGGKAKGSSKGAIKGSEGGKGSSKGASSRRGGGGGGGLAANGVPVGELVPEDNAEAKKEFAEEFDYGASNNKFDKVTTSDGVDGLEDRLKPLNGYDKSKSFFDSISCEATERSSDNDRQKVDRDKARQFDRETFGDTRRPPRPTGGRPGKGRRWGGGKGNFKS